MESLSHILSCKLGRIAVAFSSAQTSAGFKMGRDICPQEWGRVTAKTQGTPVSSRTGCRWCRLMQTAFPGGANTSHHHIFTLLPQLPTPVFNLVSREHEACIYEYRCFRDEEAGHLKKTRDSDQALYYLMLSFYSALPKKLCCKVNLKQQVFNIF